MKITNIIIVFNILIAFFSCSSDDIKNEYYPNGHIKKEYIKQEKNKYIVNIYNPFGDIISTGFLINGRKEGLEKVFFDKKPNKLKGLVYYNDDYVVKSVVYDTLGNITSVFNAINRNGEGIQKAFYENNPNKTKGLIYYKNDTIVKIILYDTNGIILKTQVYE